MKLKYFLYASIASCLIYMLIFTFVVHKPLTIGINGQYYQKKMSYLKSIDSKKLILLAGSNGRFSHRCETIENEIGISCVNMSISADISLDYQFEKIKPYLNAGDIVYLPLEYGKLNSSKKKSMSGSQVPYVVAYDHSYFRKMDVEQVMNAMFYFDVKYLISSIGEMILDSMGIKRRFSVETMTLQGDEATHTLEKAKSYRDYRNNLKWAPPVAEVINLTSYGATTVKNFLHWATANKVTVIGGLPTTFNDQPISDALIAKIQHFYTSNGHSFIVPQNKCQYPRENFYDTSYHLAEEFQIKHSKMLAKKLSEKTTQN
jgi:hypothetical protein